MKVYHYRLRHCVKGFFIHKDHVYPDLPTLIYSHYSEPHGLAERLHCPYVPKQILLPRSYKKPPLKHLVFPRSAVTRGTR
eukprot:Awhi_evm1s5894